MAKERSKGSSMECDNRFAPASGPGIFAKTASFDHIIRGNVFCLGDRTQPAVFLATPDCIGVEVTGNRILGGNGKVAGGIGKPELERDNVLEPADQASRPQPPMPSIFEWQRAQNSDRQPEGGIQIPDAGRGGFWGRT